MNELPNLVPRLTPEQIIERDELSAAGYEEVLKLDLECLGEEPSDDELIEDEKRRNDVGQDQSES